MGFRRVFGDFSEFVGEKQFVGADGDGVKEGLGDLAFGGVVELCFTVAVGER